MADAKPVDLLDSLIANNSIQLHQEAKDWQHALELTFKPLITSGCVTALYVENVIKSTLKHGPYYILQPGILAMPHASPLDGGVKQDAFSLVIFTKPVKFNAKDQAQVFVGFAGVNPETHLTVAISEIVGLFEDPTVAHKMLKLKTAADIIQLISSCDYKKYLKPPKEEQ